MNNKILDKIKKLLSLATSSNEHEAQAASAMATELLTKHNLDMQAINFSENEYSEESVFHGGRRKVEHKFLCSILSDYFNVQVVTDMTGIGSNIKIVGDKVNLDVALFTFTFLDSAFKRLFNQYRKETGAPAKARQSYYYGLYTGFCTQMEEAKKKAETERGLMVIQDPGLVKYYNDLHPRTRKTTSSCRTGDKGAQEAGTEAGRNLRVSRGIESSGGNTGKYLGGR